MHKLIDVNQKFKYLRDLSNTRPTFKGYIESGHDTIRLNYPANTFCFLTNDILISTLYKQYIMVTEQTDTNVTSEKETDEYCYLKYKKCIMIENKPAHLELVNKYYRLALLNFDSTDIVNSINEQVKLRNFYSKIIR